MYKYPVIVFEGIETSGKSTYINKVSDYLNKINRKFIKLREPGGSKYSEIIRNLVLSNKSKLSFKSDLLMIMASRSENVDKLLKVNYGKKIILIDRFTDSTIAYQHYGLGIDLSLIKKINNFVIGNFKPDITFLCTVNNNNMIKRLKKRKLSNKYDKFNYSFYKKVQRGYLKISNSKKKYVLIDTNKKNIKENSKKIINNLIKLIN